MSNGNEDPQPGVALSDGPVRNPDVVKTRKAREDHKYRQRWLLHTLSRKNLMALTGFFLCLFLVIHLFGNLQLLLPAKVARWQFNFYSKLLSENIFIELISYVLFATILAHAIYALLITIQNRRSNGQCYEYDRRGVISKWYSRKMGLLGTIILFFLIIHLRDFWYRLQFGHVPLDQDGQKDLYTLVVTVYHHYLRTEHSKFTTPCVPNLTAWEQSRFPTTFTGERKLLARWSILKLAKIGCRLSSFEQSAF